ncbi:hypothetical protein EXE51_16330 [Halorubrum sp. CGM5_25_10-8B]|uniref:hypothetical protein n=1 Tax=Halorubrum sp. CGM5_25_10-8B TaxID=2518115 RepID=UPI0010F92FCE|nr:hypothetical protein [Halorubrum sp. CGM5_25_10-8B]TKX35039.1 hypothetical protein EXE51_16330 [Halorubrum sp. CGM5_25_10-8B]
MSKSFSGQRRTEKKRDEILEQLHEDFEPYTESRQAKYHAGEASWERLSKRGIHNDGKILHEYFLDEDGNQLRPFYRKLEALSRIAQRDGIESAHWVYQYPEAYLDALIHVDDAELWALERGDLDAEIIAEQPIKRRRVLEWLAKPENEHVLKALHDGGTDIWAHSEPGEGKTSFANMVGGVRMPEVNNETVLWMLTLDELECLPLAPFMTIAVPEGVEIEVHAKPRNPTLPTVEIDLTDVFRDTLTYTTPRDLINKIVPGGLYAVLPDPLFRGCEKLTAATYTPAREAEELAEVTPLRDVAFAFLESRAKDDDFLHPTLMVNDEFSDLVPLNPEADENDLNRKVKRYPVAQGKARKKNFSTMTLSHSVARVDEGVREKTRWFVTMPNTPPPSSSLSGIGNVPIDKSYVNNFADEVGKGVIWRNQNYAPISWENPYRRYKFRGEISVSYPRREEALDEL